MTYSIALFSRKNDGEDYNFTIEVKKTFKSQNAVMRYIRDNFSCSVLKTEERVCFEIIGGRYSRRMDAFLSTDIKLYYKPSEVINYCNANHI